MYEQVELIKGHTPDKGADSLGGTINLKSRSPLSMKERRRTTYNVSARWAPPGTQQDSSSSAGTAAPLSAEKPIRSLLFRPGDLRELVSQIEEVVDATSGHRAILAAATTLRT